jgi:multiple antibiotic resistance protein
MVHNFGLSFLAFFVALDIVGMLPMFVSMTAKLNAKKRNSIVDTSMVVALAVAIVFVVIGETIFGYLGITLYDFKIAGGLVLLLISLADLVGGPESVNKSSGATGIVPLAVPLITGPAILATLVLQVNAFGYLISISALVANYFLAWVVLRNSEKVTTLIGKDGTVVVSKLVALLLATIAVSMIRSGIMGVLESLKS